jgi:NHLM bacteriocin system ABC transporter ATP-binding protein
MVAAWVNRLSQVLPRAGTGEESAEALDIARLLESGRIWDAIDHLHSLVLRSVASEASAKAADDRDRLRRRSELDRAVLQSAYSQLSAVLATGRKSNRLSRGRSTGIPRNAPGPDSAAAEDRVEGLPQVGAGELSGTDSEAVGRDPLVAAVSLVAESLGVSLGPPPVIDPTLPAAQRLQRFCDAFNLHSRKALLRGDWWRHDHGPLLAFLAPTAEAGRREAEDRSHPVALLPAAKGYRQADPLTGLSTPVDKVVSAGLAREVFMLYPVPGGGAVRPEMVLRSVLRCHRQDLGLIFLMALAGGLLSLAVPVVTGIIYGKIIPESYRPELAQLVSMLVVAALGATAFQITRALAVLRLATKLDLSFQPALWSRLLSLPVSFFRRFAVGDLAERIQGIGAIHELLLADVTTTALALVVSAASFLLLFFYSWQLALLATTWLAGLAGVTVFLAMRQMGHRRNSLEVQGRIASLAFALIQGIAKIRSGGAELRAFAAWAVHLAEQSRHGLKAQRVAAIQVSFNAFYLVGAELSLFALMGFRLRFHLSTSSFLAFAAAFGQVQIALLTFISLLPELLTILPIYERLKPVLTALPETDESKGEVDLAGDIEVDRVSFRYQRNGPLILDEVSFRARPSELIAIVGASGSGKSTLIRLLLGFERPASGAIRYDGQDLTELDLKGVRRQIGAVLQSSKPITGDIFTNIVGGTSTAMDAAWEAARIAAIDEEIRRMPMGMHTLIGEGATTFSGGERQRLMIARAVVHKPRVLLLDEATSALDNPTQEKIQRCFEGLDATRIVVAHRLSTIQHADRIYVLDGGRIVEQGTYDELSRRPGFFEKMIDRQLG